MLLLVDEEKIALVNGIGRALSLELENHHTIVMTGSEKVNLRMCCNYPETIILSLEGLNGGTLIKIPNPDSFILTYREYKILVRVE